MPRQARGKSESGVYHIILRGINQQDIFYEDDDFQRFLETIADKKSEQEFLLHAYCLMNNHVHLLIQENTDNISRIMSRLGTSYAWWYNRKYNRSGYVFQGRFGSECVENDAYMLTVMRYIHNNPVKAAISAQPEDYPWSSIHAYYEGKEYPAGLTETGFILKIFDDDINQALLGLQAYMKNDNNDKCIDYDPKYRKSDLEIKLEIEHILNGQSIWSLHQMDKGCRREIIKQIKEIDGASQRQIARVTGLNSNIIFKA